jgi:ketosteroid isomerase-like protein
LRRKEFEFYARGGFGKVSASYGERVPPGTDPTAVAARFNDSINRRDVDGLANLMSDDHRFVDTEANVVSGKQACLDAWRGFFDLFPDYRNVFTSLTANDDVVSIVGYSECADPSLAGPALWTARVRGETVTEWRVHTDTPDTRAKLGITVR